MDFAKISRDAMIEARTEMERECKHAKPRHAAGESDAQAIQRLALGCVDMAEIGREVQAELAKAMDEVRAEKDMSDAERSQAHSPTIEPHACGNGPEVRTIIRLPGGQYDRRAAG